MHQRRESGVFCPARCLQNIQLALKAQKGASLKHVLKNSIFSTQKDKNGPLLKCICDLLRGKGPKAAKIDFRVFALISSF